MSIFRFTPSDLGPQGDVTPAGASEAVFNAFYKARQDVRQQEEAQRQTERFPMEQARFDMQVEENEYQKTIRPLREQAMRLGLASDLLGLQAKSADITFRQGQVKGQQMELAANSGVLGFFESNPVIQEGVQAAYRVYGGAQQNTPVLPNAPLSNETEARTTGAMRAAGLSMPEQPAGAPPAADEPNALLPQITTPQGQVVDVIDMVPPNKVDGPPTASIKVPSNPQMEDYSKIADAYLASSEIMESVMASSGGRMTPALSAIAKQTQSLQTVALSNPQIMKVVETKQAQRLQADMERDLEGLPLGVKEYLKRAIPDPPVTNPAGVARAAAARRQQIDSYYKNPSDWAASRGIVTQASGPVTMTVPQRISQVNAWLRAAIQTVGNDPARVRQLSAVASNALTDFSIGLPTVEPVPVAEAAPKGSRLDIQAYYAALRRAAEASGADDEELARISTEEAQALKSMSAGAAPSAAPAPGVVNPASRFQQAVK